VEDSAVGRFRRPQRVETEERDRQLAAVFTFGSIIHPDDPRGRAPPGQSGDVRRSPLRARVPHRPRGRDGGLGARARPAGGRRRRHRMPPRRDLRRHRAQGAEGTARADHRRPGRDSPPDRPRPARRRPAAARLGVAGAAGAEVAAARPPPRRRPRWQTRRARPADGGAGARRPRDGAGGRDLHPCTPAPPAVEIAAYDVVSESLTNMARHARATRGSVELSCAEDALLVRIADDGVGGADPGRVGP
jgi:hypothetical protein